MKKVLVFTVFASALLTSCSNKDVESITGATNKNELGVAVNISGKDITRAGATGSLDGASFADGTSIGVFVTGAGYAAKIAPYTLSGTSWGSPAADADKIYLTGQSATVYGFYPYDANTDIVMDTKLMTVSVPASYTNYMATQAVDYMYAANVTASNISTTTCKASLVFHHALCKVSFIINKGSSYPAGTTSGVLSKLVMTAGSTIFANKGTVSLTGGAFTPSTTPADLSSTITLQPSLVAYKNINEFNATALTIVIANTLVAPCATLAGAVTLGLTIDGRNMATATIPSTTWIAGKNYIYTVTVSGTELIVNSVAITPWIDNSSDLGGVQ